MAAVTALLVAALTACATPQQSFDSVLWLQMDGPRAELSALLQRLQDVPDRTTAVGRVEDVGLSWDGERVLTSASSSFSPDEPALIVFDIEGGDADTVEPLTFTALMFTGTRADVARADPESAIGDEEVEYSGPPSLFTCVRVMVPVGETSVGDATVDTESMGPELCPVALVDVLGHGATYAAPSVFQG